MKKIHLSLLALCCMNFSLLHGMDIAMDVAKEFEATFVNYTNAIHQEQHRKLTKEEVATIRSKVTELIKAQLPGLTEAAYVLTTAQIMVQLIYGKSN